MPRLSSSVCMNSRGLTSTVGSKFERNLPAPIIDRKRPLPSQQNRNRGNIATETDGRLLLTRPLFPCPPSSSTTQVLELALGHGFDYSATARSTGAAQYPDVLDKSQTRHFWVTWLRGASVARSTMRTRIGEGQPHPYIGCI